MACNLQDLHISTHDLTKRSTATGAVPCGVLCISTHDLTKRSTMEGRCVLCWKRFQLTTSRRGRLVISLSPSFSRYFNSRPHEEVDAAMPGGHPARKISTHDLTKRSTIAEPVMADEYQAFQLTTSRRGRRDCGSK